MNEQIGKLQARINAFVWETDLQTLSRGWRFLVHALRFCYVITRDFAAGHLNLHAMGLVYTTLLSLVPLLAVSFSVLKIFGVHNEVEPLLYDFLDPLGEKGDEVAGNVITFVENVDVGVLGTVGLGLLIYTVITLLQKIEGAFNYVWRIEALRRFGHRFGNYMSVILFGPLLVVGALGITASVLNTSLVRQLAAIEPFGSLIVFASKLVPYLLVWIAFTIVYVFVPNTRVKFAAGSTGALVAGIAWQSAGWGFATFIASSARYAAIYSSFAILILFLIWLYLNWLILLLGAQIAFYVQNPRYLTIKPVDVVLSNRLKERLALGIMYLIASSHHHNRPPWTLQRLIVYLDLPAGPIVSLLSLLRGEGFITETGEDPPSFLPARDIATLELRTLLEAVRAAEEKRFPPLGPSAPELASVEAVVERVGAAVDTTLAGATLRDLVVATKSGEGSDSGR
jgi:membrane protein